MCQFTFFKTKMQHLPLDRFKIFFHDGHRLMLQSIPFLSAFLIRQNIPTRFDFKQAVHKHAMNESNQRHKQLKNGSEMLMNGQQSKYFFVILNSSKGYSIQEKIKLD
jgi:hypothetical protein